ncbi:MAG: hypothetical protein AB1599_05565, partial [Planctomycetota bacterium]
NNSDNTIKGHFKMKCFLKIDAIPSESELKDNEFMGNFTKLLIEKSLDYISFSITTLMEQFGGGPIVLSKIIDPSVMKITLNK